MNRKNGEIKTIILLIGILFLSFLVLGDKFAYNDLVEESSFLHNVFKINTSIVTVNNSIFWDGNAWSNYRWLTVSGSNANQDIDISPYNLTAGGFIGDGSQLTNLPAGNPFDQDLNTFNNVTFVNVTGKNGTFEYLNVTKDLFVSNSTLYIGNVSLSSAEINGSKALLIPQTEVFATYFIGDGSRLTNITFENGTVIAEAVNASMYYGGNYTGENYTGENFFGGNFFGVYDWIAELPWLNFNGTYLYFNETHFNQSVNTLISNLNTSELNFTSITLNGTTIYDWGDINYTVSNDTIVFTTPSFTGSYSTILPENINFEIAQIIVVPSITTGNYRFGMYESPSGETIDADLQTHSGTWNIFKSYPIDGKVSLNFSSVSPAKSFTTTIKYFTNVNN